MYKNLNKHEFNYERLDSLAKDNPVIRDKQFNEMKNILRKAANLFDFVSETKIESIATRLIESGFGCYALDKAVNTIIDRCDKFPSYKGIKDIVSSYMPKEDAITSDSNSAEDNEYKKLKDKFINAYGQEKIEPFVRWWFEVCYCNLNQDLIETFKLSIALFEKPALFDWRDSGFKLDKDIIKNTFNKKKI